MNPQKTTSTKVHYLILPQIKVAVSWMCLKDRDSSISLSILNLYMTLLNSSCTHISGWLGERNLRLVRPSSEAFVEWWHDDVQHESH